MKIVERRMLRGPNVHSHAPCYMAIVDLEDLDEVSSADLPGFTDRLVALVPTLIEHRCSEGHRGGFIERLRMGTYPAHIAEHLTLALQNLAGHDVGYGGARCSRRAAWPSSRRSSSGRIARGRSAPGRVWAASPRRSGRSSVVGWSSTPTGAGSS